ncbi:MAG: threonine--tRNA ligase [Candidatus Aenigmarchaeota archaeon]|nr:threonine--tRNA ligase [Candidatus Aenigmarchaeota archaeon]
MRILQSHSDFIEFEPTQKEIPQAEDVEKRKYRYDDVVVLFVSVEEGDNESIAKKAVDDVKDFLGKVKCNRIVIYPFAHLSRDLARPLEALKIVNEMESYAKSLKIETYRAPFGWTKALNIKIKGHPLAETAKIYSKEEKAENNLKFDEKKIVRQTKKIILDRTKLPPNDHRILGQNLKIFTFADQVGAGLPLWLPNGEIIRHQLEEFMRKMEEKYGYKYVSTPAITKGVLYHETGHLPYYQDSMYPPFSIEDEEYYLKPMNCPHHHMIFKQLVKSHRDLPLRLAEAGTTYRKELSGVTYGLIRVLAFCQNDAHIYVTKDQLKDEFIKVLQLFKEVYEVMGIKGYWFRLSLPDFKKHPEKYTGDHKEWKFASEEIRDAMKEFGQKFVEGEGEAAFYGPKIDVQIKNTLGKEETVATSQIDIVVPKRLGLVYTDKDGGEKNVIVIHRAVLGSYERFIAYLLEQTNGNLPVWLSPVHVKILTISEDNIKYAKTVERSLAESGIRVEADYNSLTIEHKIRNAQMQKVPYSIVIGKKEESNKTVAVRSRDGKVKYGTKLKDFAKQIHSEIEECKKFL